MKKKILSAFLAVSMLETTALPAFATGKEEVVYVSAGSDGNIDNVYIVNSFNGGDITDYGEYSSVKLMNVDGSVEQKGDEITFSSPENQKVYYQGNMKNPEMPWIISIRYFLGGKELSADEIAGKSGDVEIRINISENKKCKSDFYDNYALQCNFTLDTAVFSNIKADGATVANVGSKKQITYMVLAGRGLEKSITATADGFEMPSASINGIRMNLGIDIDYDGNISDLTDGAEKLDNGSKELYNGAVELNGGVSDLNDGIKKLRDGINTAQDGLSELNSKSSELKNGSSEIKNALFTIQSALSSVSGNTNQLEKLVSASSQIKSGIDSLCDGLEKLKSSIGFEQYKNILAENGLDTDTLKSANEQAVQQITAQITELKSALEQIQNIPQYAEQTESLTAQIAQLETIAKLLSGNNAFIGSTELYLNNVSGAVEQLESGCNELKEKYAEFDSAVNSLADSLSDMLVNMSSLSDGINTLVSEYSKLDNGIVDYTDGVNKLYEGFKDINSGTKQLADGGITLSNGTAELVNGTEKLSDGTGELRDRTSVIDTPATEELTNTLDCMTKDYKTVSFASDKNTDVSSVQFVISTKAIEIPESEDTPPETEDKTTFRQKLLNLFKKD